MSDEKLAEAFPNIEAIARGMISGAFREWPKVQPEAKALLASWRERGEEIERLKEIMAELVEERDGARVEVERLMAELAATRDNAALPTAPSGMGHSLPLEGCSSIEHKALREENERLKAELAAAREADQTEPLRVELAAANERADGLLALIRDQDDRWYRVTGVHIAAFAEALRPAAPAKNIECAGGHDGLGCGPECAAPAEYVKGFGDERLCACGHTYYRHFDSYDNKAPIGCKYCSCQTWIAPEPTSSEGGSDV